MVIPFSFWKAQASGTPVDMLLDFSGATSGATLTTAILDAAKRGGSGYSFSLIFGGSHTGSGAMLRTTVVTDGTGPSYSSPMAVGGTSYSSSGDKALVVDHTGRSGNDGKWEGFRASATGTPTDNITLAGFIKFGATGIGSRMDLVNISNSGTYAVLQHFIDAQNVVQAHADGNGGGVYGPSGVVTNQWYRFDLRMDISNGVAELLLRDPSTGAALVASRHPTQATAFGFWQISDYLEAYGGETRYKGLAMALAANATFPLGSFTLSAPGTVSGTQVGLTAEVTVTWDGAGFLWDIERYNGGTWTALETDYDIGYGAKSYADTGVTLGQTYKYRVRAKINGYTSAWTESADVTPSAGTPTAWMTGFTPGSALNNYTGKLGMKFTVGGADITVSAVGRWKIAGNSGSPTVQIYRVSDDALMGGATVNLAAGTSGTFVYTDLGTPITLAANTAYYVVCGVTNGGDQWYDDSGMSGITTTGAASLTGSVYDNGSSFTQNLSNKAYVPVNFKYLV